jgi:cellulose synthase/poly-beta-1,6-N-acetylglucosamine synthase-like glycosyltransferase
LISNVLGYVWLLWLVPTPYLAYFFISYVRENHKLINRDLSEPIPRNPRIIFQITSRNCPPIVQEAVYRIIQVAMKVRYTNYRIDVVTDREAIVRAANTIIVPREYQTKNHARFKSRALHYAVEYRRLKHDNGKDTWILHLDEESFVTSHTLISILKYLGRPDPALVSEGPIIYPNKMFEVGMTRYSESLRPYTCYNCVSQMTGSVPLNMHGSNLLVRADIEDFVGWDFEGIGASEDQLFGHEVWRKVGSVFGWHGGLLEEQPPITASDFIKQRRRWLIGNIANMRAGKLPWRKKVNSVGQSISWMMGFPAGIATMLAFVLPQDIPFWPHIALFGFTLLWLLTYQVGLELNIQPFHFSRLRKIKEHVIVLILTVPLGLMETYAAFTAPFHMRRWVWESVPKSRIEEIPPLPFVGYPKAAVTRGLSCFGDPESESKGDSDEAFCTLKGICSFQHALLNAPLDDIPRTRRDRRALRLLCLLPDECPFKQKTLEEGYASMLQTRARSENAGP